MTKSPVHVVLHGGLGNQLFQCARALVEAGEPHVRLVLDTGQLQRYSAPRSVELEPFMGGFGRNTTSTNVPSLGVRLRLPKILAKAVRRELVFSLPGCGTVVDGYFQSLQSYPERKRSRLVEVVNSLRLWAVSTGLIHTPYLDSVTHLRLKDFFGQTGMARDYVRDVLSARTGKLHVVTDDEEIVRDVISEYPHLRQVVLVETGGMAAIEVLGILSAYSRIQTNGSSLAFWSAVLGSTKFSSTTKDHNDLHQLLTSTRRS